jgi:hypothetical protein
MPGGCGDVDGVRPAVKAAVDEGDVPSVHFPNLVAAFAGAASIRECGETAIGVSIEQMFEWVDLKSHVIPSGGALRQAPDLNRFKALVGVARRMGAPVPQSAVTRDVCSRKNRSISAEASGPWPSV